ncbi:MAG: polyhydroxybutyrate depolymerase [Pseudomonadales bacterium]|jgi:polyhydroxybutyrate depolymerase
MLKKIPAVLVMFFITLVTLYVDYFKLHSWASPPTIGSYKTDNITVDTLKRSFNYYLPENLEPNSKLIFIFHGSHSSAETIRQQTAYQFDYLGNDNNFIAVYPSGFEGSWNDCRASAKYSANTNNINDPAFITAMIEYFDNQYKINLDQVFALGLSNGGQFVYRLAHEMPTRFAGFAAIAANPPSPDNFDCIASGKPVSMAILNGTEDPLNPYNGGLVDISGDTSRGHVISSIDNGDYWRTLANLDQFSETILTKETDNSVIKAHWTSAQVSQQVALFTFSNSGHVIPSRKVKFQRIRGPNPAELESSELIWQFFSQLK